MLQRWLLQALKNMEVVEFTIKEFKSSFWKQNRLNPFVKYTNGYLNIVVNKNLPFLRIYHIAK